MKRVGFVSDPVYLEHDTGASHPERSSRLLAIDRQLKKDGIRENLKIIKAYEAPLDILELVHSREYIASVNGASESGKSFLNSPDCVVSPMTYKASLWSSGGVLAAIDSVMSLDTRRAFASVRPPGHHAEHSVAMGFCFFNNIAIASRYLQKRYSVDKVFILDWDVHHGNGTQHSFEEDDSIFYASMHEDPRYCYPGTGYADEVGKGRGRNYTLNLPIMPSVSDDIYIRVFRERVIPALYSFRPDFILISAGFDAHRDDPLANLNLTEDAYALLTKEMVLAADELCSGRLVSILEGGYDLLALGKSVSNHINAL